MGLLHNPFQDIDSSCSACPMHTPMGHGQSVNGTLTAIMTTQQQPIVT